MEATPGTEPFLSMRDAVMEIRADVKGLATLIDRVDREGSIGTKQELIDHEQRLRSLETTGFRASGAFATLSVIAATLAGLAGLGLGTAALFFN